MLGLAFSAVFDICLLNLANVTCRLVYDQAALFRRVRKSGLAIGRLFQVSGPGQGRKWSVRRSFPFAGVGHKKGPGFHNGGLSKEIGRGGGVPGCL